MPNSDKEIIRKKKLQTTSLSPDPRYSLTIEANWIYLYSKRIYITNALIQDYKKYKFPLTLEKYPFNSLYK